MTKLLEKSKTTKELLSFTKHGDETFWFGYVTEYSEEHVAIQHFTKYGKNDGIILHPLSDFQRIDYHDDYSKAMQPVIDYSDEIHKSNNIKLNFNESEDFYLSIIRQFLEEKNIIISIQINNDEYSTGYINEISEIDFSMICVGKMGEDLGISILKVEDITSIQIDDIDNRKRNLLYKWRKTSL
ncbi:hypothetical protein [Flavobacterium sp. SM2513]|uniref:hypothetical protein n=1 Tax=Flavobacterium sp. SM2513 TaxID=3424766 RepID=UPI003D7F5FCF